MWEGKAKCRLHRKKTVPIRDKEVTPVVQRKLILHVYESGPHEDDILLFFQIIGCTCCLLYMNDSIFRPLPFYLYQVSIVSPVKMFLLQSPLFTLYIIIIIIIIFSQHAWTLNLRFICVITMNLTLILCHRYNEPNMN